MALDYPFTIDGVSYIVKLELPDSGKDPFVIPGYDMDPELAAEALGLGKTPVIQLFEDWASGLDKFLMHRERLEIFLNALYSQRSREPLGLSPEKLGDALSDVVEELFYENAEDYGYDDWPDFFDSVSKYYPLYKKLKWRQKTIDELAEAAYDFGVWEIFSTLNELSEKPCYELIVGQCRCEIESSTLVSCEIDFEFKILDFTKDQFTISGTYAYRDAELSDPTFEADDRRYSYSAPNKGTTELLDELGEETEWECYMESHCWRDAILEPPPNPDDNGNCAIFINNQFYDRFDCDSGSLFEEMSQETIDREGLGEDVMLYMLRDDVDPDDPDFDESDVDNWEEANW